MKAEKENLKTIDLLTLFSSMTVPIARHPNIQPGLTDQTNIALNLFNTILETTTTQVELERSWAVIE